MLAVDAMYRVPTIGRVFTGYRTSFYELRTHRKSHDNREINGAVVYFFTNKRE